MEVALLPLQLVGMVFIPVPLAALAPALLFAGLFVLRRRASAAVASGAWLAYTGYEGLMYLRVLCSGECNIRIDLLVLYPALLAISLVALVMLWRGRGARAGADAEEG